MMALVAFSLQLSAQQSDQPRGERGARQQWNPEQRAEQVAKDLELTADQQKQLKEMYVKQQEEMAKLRDQAQGGDQAARRQQFTELRKKWDADMEMTLIATNCSIVRLGSLNLKLKSDRITT